MNPGDRILLLCTRQAFSDEHRAAVERLAAGTTVPWHRLVGTAERHGVLPIVGVNLRRCDAARIGLTAATIEELELAVLRNVAEREREAHRLEEALVRLSEVELDAMLLKTSALVLGVYAEPWVAVSRDIDLTLRPRPGWSKGKGTERAVRRALYHSGVECDLHGHHDITLNGVLPIDFERVWREARPVRFRGVATWTMSSEDQLIALAVNACRKRFFRLKCLFDLAESLRRGERVDAVRLAALARAGRCDGIVHAALVAAQAALGTALPSDLLDALRPPPRRARLLQALVATFVRAPSLDGAPARAIGWLLALASMPGGVAWRTMLAPGQLRLSLAQRRQRAEEERAATVH